MILFPILLSVLGGIFVVVLGFSRWIPADRETYAVRLRGRLKELMVWGGKSLWIVGMLLVIL